MTATQTVSAQFLKDPVLENAHTIQIVSGLPDQGSGTVRSQSGLIPAIDCQITNGTVAAHGCSASYPANTELVLTAIPGPGNTLVGWCDPCNDSVDCSLRLSEDRTAAVTFALTKSAELGRWSAPFPWPIVGVHLHLLPTGEVLSFGKKATPEVWNVATGTFTSVPSSYLMFCGGHAFLPDGRLLLTGGNIRHDHGLSEASIFDPRTRTLSRVTSMVRGRWYPTNTTLADGEVMTIAGADAEGVMVDVPEVWTGSSWRQLSDANLRLPYYPWMFQAPDGSVFDAGPAPQTHSLNFQGAGSWTNGAVSRYGDRPSGSAVMYEPGKVLIVGGGGGTDTTLPTRTAETIDLTVPNPSWQSTGSMAFARRHLNATLLPTGEVLVTGGTSGPGYNDAAGSVHQAELWNPDTGTWKTLSSNTINRIYHSAAILLPDGRVLVTGAGARPGDVDQLNAEFYSPPYLFRGPAPSVTDAPDQLFYNSPFTVNTPDAGSIAKVTLLRLGSVTHSFNQNQRFISLAFQPQSNGLSVRAPKNGSVAPPGDYLIFLVNNLGVPSIGRFVNLR
jgi:hypothetical protein